MSDDARYLPDAFPLPAVDEFNRAFFSSGTLALQTCRSCTAVQHPPGEICFSCGEFDFEYIETPAYGTISSYTVIHHVTHPMLAGLVPYNVVIVELDGFPNVQLVGNLLDPSENDLRVGRRVCGSWTEPLNRNGQDPVRLLQWRALDA